MVFALVLASCKAPAEDADKPKASKGKVGISVLTMTNPFFKEIADVFKADMEKAGYAVIVVDPDHDVVRQKNQVNDFLAQNVSAIVLCPCQSMEIGAAIQEANKKGVPVFTADIACTDPKAKVVTHVATDNYEGGKQAGLAMIEALAPRGGKVLVLHLEEVESCQLRVKGFNEVREEHNKKNPDAQIIVADTLPCQGNREKGYKSTQDALQSHPDLVGIFAINDPSALGARAALEKAKKADQVKIIGFDGQREGKQAILEGKIYADPIQYPDQIAHQTADAILRHFRGERPEPQILIRTNLYRKADAEKDTTLKQ
ncbi:MAG: substrate-binding domain-containing protein [Planctomycetes bacterium]|nr:substrate-binding domain-containing protein [Planctomycetota bacterium]